MTANAVDQIPWWAWAGPLAAAALVTLKFAHFVPADARRGHKLSDGDEIEIVAPMQGG